MIEPVDVPRFQRLHRAEQMLLMVDETLRDLGSTGFGLQLHVRFAGRCDVERLRLAISRLGRQYPVTTARLDRSQRTQPVWRFRPEAHLELQVRQVPTSGEESIVLVAEELLGTASALDRSDPLQFVLVQSADGTEVLIVQYSHVLMDSNAALLLLVELNRLAVEEPGPPVAEDLDYRSQSLTRHSWWVRGQSAWAAVRQRARLQRHPIAMLTETPPDRQVVAPTRILLRALEPEATKAFAARVRRITGFRGLSLALLVSAFRALKSCLPDVDPQAVLAASVGMNLRDPNVSGPIFRNLASLLRFGLPAGDLRSWEESLKRLNHELRAALSQRIDLGTIQLTSLINPHSSRGRRLNERGMFRQQSLGYGYFGTSLQERAGLCGTPIERLYHIVQTWSPPGLALVANESQGRLLMSIMYTPATVSREQALQFADALVACVTSAVE